MLSRRELLGAPLRTPLQTDFPPLHTPANQFLRPLMTTYPVIDAQRWRLTIIRADAKRETISLTDLLALPYIERDATISNAPAPTGDLQLATARWRGVHLSQVFPGTMPALRVMSAHGKVTHLSAALAATAFLAYQMGGQPLPPEQGAPLRLIVPGGDAGMMPGWVRRIEVIDDAGLHNHPVQPPVYVTILPTSGRLIAHTPVLLGGYAYAALERIDRVDISINGSAWQPIAVTQGEPGVWSRWSCRWSPPSAGDSIIRIRAWAAESAGETFCKIRVETA